MPSSPVPGWSLDIKPTLTSTIDSDRIRQLRGKARTPVGHTPQTTTGAPVACTLGATDLAAQALRWKQLAARAMEMLVRTEDGVRIILVAHAGVETELRALADVESRCCRWARWSVESAGDRVTLVARSGGNGIATLHAMFADLLAPAR